MAGEKTVTRRRFSDNERSPWWSGGCRYRKGSVFAVNPGRGAPRVGDAQITADVYCERLCDIGEGHVRREGFASRAEFLQAFHEINPRTPLDVSVWVVEFEVVR